MEGWSLKKYCQGKTYVFIDAANILYSQQTLGWRFDYGKLLHYLKKEIDLKKIFYYTGQVGSLEKQSLFISKLKKLGFVVVSKEVKFIRINAQKSLPKANLDIELALDAYRFKRDYKTMLLFSGDSDFSYLVKLLRTDNKQVVTFSTRGHISKELIAETNKYVDLRKLRKELEYKPKES